LNPTRGVRCLHEERGMNDEVMDEGIETSISDEIDGDEILMAKKPKGIDYVEQDN
jgi:hypothetical protein